MCEAVFQAPRRKRKVYESYEAPLPLPLEGAGSRLCRAELSSSHVLVRSPEDIRQLYQQGFFGKGILSRSRPEFSISDPELIARWKDSKPHFPVVTSRKYQYHVQWARSLMRKQGLRDLSINSILDDYTKPLDLPSQSEKEDVEANTKPLDLPSQSEKEDVEANQCSFGTEPDIQNVEDEVKHLALSPCNDGDPDCGPLEVPSGGQDIKKVRLEGDSTYDPLAKYGTDTVETVDREALAKVYCHRHDDLIVHCGCRMNESLKSVHQESPSQRDHDHEYVLVQEEESHFCNVGEEDEKQVKTEKLVCRRNPFRIYEYLQLGLEEAFFLVYALGCLSITYNKEPLSILKLWEVFSEVQPSFRTTYMAYHYFRSKGWVPKVGLKYGTDLLLYRKGPPFYHASYSVIVELVNDRFQGPLRRPFSWKSLAGLNRTTVNVSKELLFCYLIRPSDMTENDMCSPECMKRIKVQELIVSRWVSSRERTEQEEL